MNLLYTYGYIFNWAGYPAIFSIRYPASYPARYPASQIRYPVGYRIQKKAGLSGRISGASLVRDDKLQKLYSPFSNFIDDLAGLRIC
jgi:hypothetical protein